MKVLFMVNIPAPYRMDFFNELGKYCALTVAFEGKRALDRDDKWKAEETRNYKAIYLRGIRTGTDSFFCPGILKVLKKKWDIIVAAVFYTPTSMLAIEYMIRKHIPYYIETDGGIAKGDNGLKYLAKKHFISKASAWLTTGKEPIHYLEYYGADVSRCYIYPFTSIREKEILCIDDIKRSNKQFFRDRIGIKEKQVVLTVGQIIYRKGLDVLIKATKQIDKEIGVYIVGGKPTDELSKLVDESDKNIHFVDFKMKDELLAYYRAADVFVLPTREDTWGLVVNEAMANGLPVITTNKCTAGLELVKDNINGYIVPVEDYEILSNKLIKILEDEEILARMGEKSLRTIKGYTIEKMAEKHMEIFRQIKN